jgi:hypothetical protein
MFAFGERKLERLQTIAMSVLAHRLYPEARNSTVWKDVERRVPTLLIPDIEEMAEACNRARTHQAELAIRYAIRAGVDARLTAAEFVDYFFVKRSHSRNFICRLWEEEEFAQRVADYHRVSISACKQSFSCIYLFF